MAKRATKKSATKAKSTKPAKAKPLARDKATRAKTTIALVYDFDGTLSPRPMQEYAFLPTIGADPSAFWQETMELAAKQNADPMIVYMRLLYEKARAKNVRIDRDALVDQGAAVAYFKGVEQWFDELGAYVTERAEDHGVELRHYLISAGLREIVEGTTIFKHFHNVFASEYWFDAYDVPYPKRVMTDTGKTQYLFRINKGIEDERKSINHHMPEDNRPIPFANMIYFGDGDTDVPSMAVMRKNGGHAVAVYPPGRSKKKCIELFDAERVDFYAPADYRAGSDLFKRTCLLLDRILADIRVQEEMQRLGRSAK